VKPTVVLLQVPGAVFTPWRHDVAAAATLFYGGEATGDAWAATLFGDASPEGKLPIMLPATTEDVLLPSVQETQYQEGLFTSYRSNVFKAAFPFGHGLSYTTFSYKDPDAWMHPSAAPTAIAVDTVVFRTCSGADACACVTVVNAGTWPGREVAQLYLEFPSAVNLPTLQLRGFHKTRLLHPAETEMIAFPLRRRDLSIYNASLPDKWRLQRHVRVHIGSSSADIRHVLTMRTDGQMLEVK